MRIKELLLLNADGTHAIKSIHPAAALLLLLLLLLPVVACCWQQHGDLLCLCCDVHCRAAPVALFCCINGSAADDNLYVFRAAAIGAIVTGAVAFAALAAAVAAVKMSAAICAAAQTALQCLLLRAAGFRTSRYAIGAAAGPGVAVAVSAEFLINPAATIHAELPFKGAASTTHGG